MLNTWLSWRIDYCSKRGRALDFYEIIGVTSDAEPSVIAAAYRAKMRLYHPDVFQGPTAEAERKARALNEAYAILADPANRAAYDQSNLRQRSSDQESTPAPPKPTSPPPPFQKASIEAPVEFWRGRRFWVSTLLVMVLTTLSLLVWLVIESRTTSPPEQEVVLRPEVADIPGYQDEYLSNEPEQFFVTGPANVRSLPSATSTTITTALSVHDLVEGKWVRGLDEDSRWLRITWEGDIGYVWEQNILPDLPITLDWLVGNWGVCGTDDGYTLTPSGEFFYPYGHRGTYTFETHHIITQRTHHMIEGEPPEVDVTEPPTRNRIFRYGPNLLEWVSTYRRFYERDCQ